MTSQTPRFLGSLSLEYGLPPGAISPPPEPGSMLNPASYDFPIITEP